MGLSDEIKDAIRASGKSQAEIAAAVGIHPISLSRFMVGTRGIGIDVLEAIAAHLGYKPTIGKPAKQKRKK